MKSLDNGAVAVESTANILFDVDRAISALQMPQFSRKLTPWGNIKRALKSLFVLPSKTNNGMMPANSIPGIALVQIAATLASRSGNPVIASYLAMFRNIVIAKEMACCVERTFSFDTTFAQRVWYGIQHNDLAGTEYANRSIMKLKLKGPFMLVSVSCHEKQFLIKFAQEKSNIKFMHHGKEYTAEAVSTNIDTCAVADSNWLMLTPKSSVSGNFVPYVCLRVGKVYIAYMMYMDVPWSGQLDPRNMDMQQMNAVMGDWANGNKNKPIQVCVVNYGDDKVDPSISNDVFLAIARKNLNTSDTVYSFDEHGALIMERRPVIKFKPLPVDFDKKLSTFKYMFEKHLHRGVCLIGKTGCGKSTFMRQISEHLPDCMTIQMKPEMLTEKASMRNMFNFMKVMKNIIILCDDLDGWIKKNKDDNISKWIAFFDKLNEMHASDGVSYLFMCTMNDPSVVNSAIIRRSDRIDEVFEFGGLVDSQLLYLLQTYDTTVNGKSSTDFTSHEFDDLKAEILRRQLSPADIYNMFSHVTISDTFTGVYTANQLLDTLSIFDSRDAVTHRNYLDEGQADMLPPMFNGQPPSGVPFEMPIQIRHRDPFTGELGAPTVLDERT